MDLFARLRFIFRSPASRSHRNRADDLIKIKHDIQHLFEINGDIPFPSQPSIKKYNPFTCQSAWAILYILEHLKSRPELWKETFCYLICLYGHRLGMLDQAFHVFEEMERCGVRTTTKPLELLIQVCKANKSIKGVNRAFRELPRKHGIRLDVCIYHTVILAYVKLGSTESGYAILDEMGMKGLLPDEFTYGLLISGFYAEERYDEVEKVLKLMTKKGCPPNWYIYDRRIESLCKLKKWMEARALMVEMQSKGMKPAIHICAHLICGLSNMGNLEEAKNVYYEIVEMGKVQENKCTCCPVSCPWKASYINGAKLGKRFNLSKILNAKEACKIAPI